MPTERGVTAQPIVLTAEERRRLTRWARGRRTSARLVRRARIVLRAAAGQSNAAIARALHTDRECVARWRGRFATHRLAGIQREAVRPGRPPKISDAMLRAIIHCTIALDAPGANYWSARHLAREAEVSATTIRRIWQANGLAPHWVQRFQVRPASRILAHLSWVVGGYRTPLDSALVVCGDATGRHRPAHPDSDHCRGRRSRGHRKGPASPPRYAGLGPPPGRVIANPRLSRHWDWLQFLQRLATRIPRGRWVHVLADNPVSHQHPAVQRWVQRHPQVQLHLVRGNRPLPPFLARAVQRWVDLELPPPRRTVRLLCDAVAALQPKRARRRESAVWLESRDVIREFAGNPRWHLPPPGARLEH